MQGLRCLWYRVLHFVANSLGLRVYGGLGFAVCTIEFVFGCAAAADVFVPPPATLCAASSLLQRLEVCCCSDSSTNPWGPPVPGMWGLELLQEDTPGSSGGPTTLLLQQAAAVSGTAARGAIKAALGDLSIAIRNAACSTPIHALQQQQ